MSPFLEQRLVERKQIVDSVLDGSLDDFIEAYLLAAAGGTLKKGGITEEAEAP